MKTKCNIIEVRDNRYSPGGIFPELFLPSCYECLVHCAIWYGKPGQGVPSRCPVIVGSPFKPVSELKRDDRKRRKRGGSGRVR